jgi:hypothetical protein
MSYVQALYIYMDRLHDGSAFCETVRLIQKQYLKGGDDLDEAFRRAVESALARGVTP